MVPTVFHVSPQRSVDGVTSHLIVDNESPSLFQPMMQRNVEGASIYSFVFFLSKLLLSFRTSSETSFNVLMSA